MPNTETSSKNSLPVPPRPETPEPVLKIGWQWLDAHWAAYWMMEKQPIKKRQVDDLPYSHIKPWVAPLLKWREHPKGKLVYEKILQTPKILNETILLEWLQSANFNGEEVEALPEFGVSFFETLKFFTCIELDRKPIQYNLEPKLFSDGRHRAYAAWQCGLSSIFILVKP